MGYLMPTLSGKASMEVGSACGSCDQRRHHPRLARPHGGLKSPDFSFKTARGRGAEMATVSIGDDSIDFENVPQGVSFPDVRFGMLESRKPLRSTC